VDDGALDRVPLDVADQRARRRAVDVELDDGRFGRDVPEQATEFTRVDGEGLRARAWP